MKRTWSNVSVIVLVIAACKGGGESKSGSGDNQTAAGGCAISATKPAELVAGKTPQPIAPFSALKLGMTPAEVKPICTNYFSGEDGKKTGTFSAGEVVGRFGDTQVYGRLNFTDDKLTEISVDAPAEIADALTAAWGAPQASPGTPTAHAWHDDATGVRAILAPVDDGRRELVVTAYVPLKAFIEPDPTRLAFKPQDVLGKTPKELMEKFPQFVRPEHLSEATKAATEAMMADLKKDVEAMGVDTSKKGENVEVTLPATPFAGGTTTQAIVHQNDDGTVREYEVWFRTKAGFGSTPGWPGEITEVVKLFDELWGPNKKIKRVLGDEATWFDPKAGIRASAEIDASKPEELDVGYVRYLPLADFFGAPGAVWGFEKPERPLIGATPDELVAAYGKAVTIDADGTTAKLLLPPTDYDDDVATTLILMFIDHGKVEHWTVSLGFEDFEPSKAEYEALLGAKLGSPKAKGDHFFYGKKPTVDAHYSDITHELDLEVTK